MMIPYGKQSISENDVEAVNNILKSDYLTTGPTVLEFEKKFASFVGSKYAVAVSNGTAALHIACMAAELNSETELITTPITFVASANCALYCQAKPVFADVKNDNSGLINPDEIKKKINSKTKVIIPVHYGGLPADLEKIHNIAKEKNIVIIEDACHAIGATYKNSKIGDCKYSDMCVFSFHPVKQMTTGEGGMITTNSEEFYKKLLLYRTHGITKNSDEFINESDEPWYYEMQELGYNYRITDFQCALGISQLSRVDEFISRRREIAKIYDKFIENSKDFYNDFEYDDRKSSYHLYVIKLKNSSKRKELFLHLMNNNISPQVHYVPVHLHPYYLKLGYKKGNFPNAEDFYSRIISIPIYYDLKEKEVEKIIKIIKDFHF